MLTVKELLGWLDQCCEDARQQGLTGQQILCALVEKMHQEADKQKGASGRGNNH